MYIIISYTYIVYYTSVLILWCVVPYMPGYYYKSNTKRGSFKWFLYLVLFPPLKKYCSPYSYANDTQAGGITQYSVGDKIFTIHTLLAIS